MRKIISIQHLESWRDKLNKRHWRTHVLLDDGTEAQGYGKEFDIGDSVQVFYHKGVIKVQKPKLDIT